MPQCPHCQTPYDQNQRYCSVCGSFLLHPEEGDTFCPQCGVRVSPKQEFCHECDAPLQAGAPKPTKEVPGEVPPAGPTPEGPPAAPQKLPPWVIGSLAVAGLVIIFLLILLFSRPAPPPAPPGAPPQTEAVAPPSPGLPAAEAPAPSEELQGELQKVLGVLREAQLSKNIDQFMSVYASSFPNADQKRKDIQASWNNYDYTNLVFTVDKVQSIDANNALAWVTWYMDVKNRATQELSSASQAYQVRFVKEKGNWRISELKEVQ